MDALLGRRADALATSRAAGHLRDGLDMLQIEAVAQQNTASLDSAARCARVHERDTLAGLDMLEAGAASAVEGRDELIAAGLPADLPGGLAAHTVVHHHICLSRGR